VSTITLSYTFFRAMSERADSRAALDIAGLRNSDR
jgi:cytochrome c oxidase assembly protein Cox11